MQFRGFSLVELLVAMTLLLLVSFTGTYAYSLYSAYWNKQLGNFEQVFAEVQGIVSLQAILKHIDPYIIRSADIPVYHWFEGGKSVIRAVTSQSLTQPEYPAAFELKVVNTDDESFALIYREKVMSLSPVLFEGELDVYDNEIVLLQGLTNVSFEYFGWGHFDDWQVASRNDVQGDIAEVSERSWFGYYSGRDTLITPERIRVTVEMSAKTAQFEVEISDFLKDDILMYLQSEE